MEENSDIYDLLVVGSGAAGLAAAVYAGRYLMKVLVVRGKFGGETATAGKIWNYPGMPGVEGFEIMRNMETQAKDSGAKIINGKVASIDNKEGCFQFTVEEGNDAGGYKASAVIFAQGAERRHLGLPNEEVLTGKGVHYCVTCDGPVYSGKTVAIVGGGDASVKGVIDIAKYVEKVYLIVRTKGLTRPEPVNLEEMKKLGDKVEVLLETEIKEIVGDKMLDHITLSKDHNGSKDLKIDGLFIEIGAKPDVGLANSIGIELDEHNYIKVNNLMETNVAGTYAAGDTVNHFGPFKQTITAAALGAVAATSAYNYKKMHGNLCNLHWKPGPNS